MVVLLGCVPYGGCRNREPPPDDHPASPDEHAARDDVRHFGALTAGSRDEPLALLSIPQHLAESETVRYRTAGKIRWVVEMSGAVSELKPYSQGGILLLAPDRIHYMTSKGAFKWERVLGPGYTLVRSDKGEIVFTPKPHRILSLGWKGRIAWESQMEGSAFPGPEGSTIVADASVVRCIRADGELAWRFASEHAHRFDTVMTSGAYTLLEGRKGRHGHLVVLGPDGRPASEIPLGETESLIGACGEGDAVVYEPGRLKIITRRGVVRWSIAFPEIRSLAVQGEDLLALVASSGDEPARLTWLSSGGEVAWSSALPDDQPPMSARIMGWPDRGVWIAGCLGPGQQCDGMGGIRTTSNVLYHAVPNGKLRPVRFLSGELFAAAPFQNAVVSAKSMRDWATLLSLWTDDEQPAWHLKLEGALEAGPMVDSGQRQAILVVKLSNQVRRIMAVTLRNPLRPKSDLPEDSTGAPGPESSENDRDGGAGGIPDRTGRDADRGTTGIPPPHGPGV